RSKTESGRLEGEQLAKGQAKVTDDTKKLRDAMGKDKKPGDPKDGKGQPKDSKGDPKDGKGQPKDGQPKDGQGQPKDGKPGDPKDDNGDKKPNPDQPKPDEAPGRQQVKDAIENQNNAEKNLKKNDRDKASGEQDEAIKDLEAVRKEIERRLKQLREEELERLLANLEARCSRMLTMQIEVYEGTKRIHATIQAAEDKKPTRLEDNKAGDLSAREALKRAQQDLKGKKDQQPPPPGGGQPPPQKLIDLLAELKMLKSLQLQVNKRTSAYGKQYPGEQADDPDIVKELHNLAGRQVK